MKKFFLFIPFIVLLASACTKNAAGGGNTIVADIDGTTKTFNNNVVGIKLNISGAYSISVLGYNGKDTSSDHMLITMGGPNPVTTGALMFDPPAGQNSAVIAYLLGGGEHGYGPAEIGGSANSITVTITSVTDTNIQGTFSGTLALDDSSSPNHKVVTNGKFNVNYH